MEISKQQLKKWLTDYHHTREWLASKCHVSTRTIGNWITDTNRPIPIYQQTVIYQLMENDKQTKNRLVLEFNRADYEKIERRARIKNMPLLEHAEKTLISDADNT